MASINSLYIYTRDPIKYEQTVKFYESIGFKLIESKQPIIEKASIEAKQLTELEIQSESWLTFDHNLLHDKTKLYALEIRNSEDTEIIEHTGSASANVIIKLTSNAEDINESSNPQSSSGKQIKSLPLFCLNVDRFNELITWLNDQKIDFDLTSENSAISLQDPIGTRFVISTSLYGLKTKKDRKPIIPIDKPALPQKIFNNAGARAIGILTSGGDSPGMSAFVRAAVRIALHRGCKAFAIYEGYNGLINGGTENIREMKWQDVRGWLSEGGTIIGTARSPKFRTRDGRLKAALNLIKRGIDSLVICGGDGSLTGADIFRAEWQGLVTELFENEQISLEQAGKFKHLSIVGVVGSIDNDMYSTDTTIGAYSSLQRICEATNTISTTALSHSRAFVIEVMGRRCGWLAIMAAVATSADYVFTPEYAPDPELWPKDLCEAISVQRSVGKRKIIIIVAEGAIDKILNPITGDQIKNVIIQNLKIDTKVTTLGHIQRGGTPCAFDRWLATLQGVEAIDAVLDSTPQSPSLMIAINERKITRKNLMEAVNLTKRIAECIEKRDFETAASLRDPELLDVMKVYQKVNVMRIPSETAMVGKKKRVAIIHVGAPAGGMNAASCAAIRALINLGHEPVVIMNGFPGLWRHDNECIRTVTWIDTALWMFLGGSEIGTNRELPDQDLGLTAYLFQKHSFDALLLIGGFEAFTATYQLQQARKSYPAFRIPMACIPATISNNVPGSDYSIGSDTCLNTLMEYLDTIKISASASRSRIFVCEVQGGHSGYIATYAGLITGAVAVYTPESGISLAKLNQDCNLIKKSFEVMRGQSKGGKIVLRTEFVSDTYTTETIANIFKAESNGRFSVRTAIPGHYQQGTVPSPIDRIRATRMALECIKFFEKCWKQDNMHVPDTACICGIRDNELLMTSVESLEKSDTIRSKRKPKNLWWQGLYGLSEILNGLGPD